MVLALGRDLLTELVRLRGTGYRGHSYVCPCGVRLEFKEVAPLQQRTWFGTITLERAVYAGAGCPVRAHHVPLDAEWALLGAVAVPATLPDPDGGALAPVAPGVGRRGCAPALAVARRGVRRAAALRRGGPAAGAGPGAAGPPGAQHRGPYTQAAGRARAQQEDAARVRTQPPPRRRTAAVFDQPLPERPARAPDTLVITLDGALERTDGGLEGGQARRRLRPRRPRSGRASRSAGRRGDDLHGHAGGGAGLRPPAARRGPAPGAGVGAPGGRAGRWRQVDLEAGRPPLPPGGADRGLVPRPRAPVGAGPAALRRGHRRRLDLAGDPRRRAVGRPDRGRRRRRRRRQPRRRGPRPGRTCRTAPRGGPGRASGRWPRPSPTSRATPPGCATAPSAHSACPSAAASSRAAAGACSTPGSSAPAPAGGSIRRRTPWSARGAALCSDSTPACPHP